MHLSIYLSARCVKQIANHLHPFLYVTIAYTGDGKNEEGDVLRILIKAGAAVRALEKGGDDTF
jgi:hypothetical protein